MAFVLLQGNVFSWSTTTVPPFNQLFYTWNSISIQGPGPVSNSSGIVELVDPTILTSKKLGDTVESLVHDKLVAMNLIADTDVVVIPEL